MKAFSLVFLFLFVLVGCREEPCRVVIFLPETGSVMEPYVDQGQLEYAYWQAVDDLRSVYPEFDQWNFEFKETSGKDSDLYRYVKSANGEALSGYVTENNIKYILHAELLAPDDERPFAHVRFTTYIPVGNHRISSMTSLRVHVEDLYTEEFWEPCFLKVLQQLQKGEG